MIEHTNIRVVSIDGTVVDVNEFISKKLPVE